MPIKSIHLQYLFICFLIGGAFAIVFLPNLYIIKVSEDFVVQIMLAYLALGFFFLIINNRRLLLTSFLCCGILCLFLKNASNLHLILPEETEESKISIAHINVSSITEEFDSLLVRIEQLDADVISFQEMTPDWEQIIVEELSMDYPHIKSYSRIDPYGKCIISRVPIRYSDTFHINGKPSLITAFELTNEEDVYVLSTHLLPPLDKELSSQNKAQLETISEIIKYIESPIIVAGDFNLVYWANEIRSFRSNSKLMNSRRAASQGGLKISYDHIFYSQDLECTSLSDIDHSGNHWGIMGSFQQKTQVASILRRKQADK